MKAQWTERCLLHIWKRSPSPRHGDIVVMDNLSAHKSQEVYDAIRREQAEFLFLPACSSELNPIENMWSKVKQYSGE
ncbi:MAG: transposase [Desulfovibrio sp.]|nr:transposase [Desulfovibrio sp.]